MEQRKRSGVVLGITSFLALGLGFLLFFEVIRPFHDGNIDMPLAIGCAVAGALLALVGVVRRRGAVWLNVVALLLNVLALIAAGLIVMSLSHMPLI
jgi:hypothetical protein